MIKKIIKDSTIRKGVLSSLIATAFFIYLLEPIINSLSKGVLLLSSFLSSTFIDGLYQEMAKGQIDYSFLLIMMVFMLGAMIFLFTGIKILSPKRKESEIDKENDDSTEDTKEKTFNKKWLFGPLSIIFASVILFTIIMANIKVSTIINFQQRMEILSPYIDSQNEKLLKSRFASMQSKEDFKSLYMALDMIAKSNSIALPEIEFTNLY